MGLSRRRTANQLQISEAEREVKQTMDGRKGGGGGWKKEVIRHCDPEDWQFFQSALTTHLTSADGRWGAFCFISRILLPQEFYCSDLPLEKDFRSSLETEEMVNETCL